MNSTYVATTALLSPVDTGFYRRMCEHGGHSSATGGVEVLVAAGAAPGAAGVPVSCADGACLACGAWGGAVGTLDALDHVLVAAAELQVVASAKTLSADDAGAVLGRLFFARNRAFLDDGAQLGPLEAGAPETYLEVGVLATPPAAAVAYAIGDAALRPTDAGAARGGKRVMFSHHSLERLL